MSTEIHAQKMSTIEFAHFEKNVSLEYALLCNEQQIKTALQSPACKDRFGCCEMNDKFADHQIRVKILELIFEQIFLVYSSVPDLPPFCLTRYCIIYHNVIQQVDHHSVLSL